MLIGAMELFSPRFVLLSNCVIYELRARRGECPMHHDAFTLYARVSQTLTYIEVALTSDKKYSVFLLALKRYTFLLTQK